MHHSSNKIIGQRRKVL